MGICLKSKKVFGICLALLCAGGVEAAWPSPHEEPTASLDADGRGFTFAIPKIMTFKGGFSATLVRGAQPRELLSTMGLPEFQPGKTQILNSAEGVLLSGSDSFTEETPFGRSTGREVALRFQRMQLDLLIRFSRVQGVGGFQVQTGIRNTGPLPVGLVSLALVSMEGQVSGKPDHWLVTALNTSIKNAPPVIELSKIQQPLKVFEYGGFYSAPEGHGFIFGPVGTPSAYVQASFEHKENSKVALTYTAEMSGVQVKPGETRWGQQVAFFAEAPSLALAHWATWVGKTHKARTDKGALSGWNSFSFHGGRISGKDVLAEVETVQKNPERFRPMVMQIDTGFEKYNKTATENLKFPEGMPFYAKRIAETGARPGILVNFQGPPGFETAAQRIREMVQSGFTYLKINRTFLEFEKEAIPTKTSFEMMREGFTRLREAAGERTYLLYNNSNPDRATVGLVDACRTGDMARRIALRNAMTDVLRSYQLNNRLFAVDNDSYYMGTDIANVSEIAGGWPVVRTWMSMVGLSCGAALTSDPWSWESFRPYWRNVEVMTPPAREETVVMDLCTSSTWSRLVGNVKRPWGDQTVALLWNPRTSERAITLMFERTDMNPKHRYAVWSFWDNRYLGVAKGSWTTPALMPSACQHLCFTDLDLTPDKPVLIGSSLHIYCGAAEIKHVSSSRSAMEIELTDAGAREGDLFIYSRQQPIFKGASGCTVSEIASAGENVWRIRLVNRIGSVAQHVTLGILLPVTQQIWFWALIGIVIASLLLAAWRYVVGLRLDRERIMERERGRIARDIHDGLGVSLTQIAMQCEVMQDEVEDPDKMRQHVAELSNSSQDVARALDEIVWAVTPTNDTVEQFVAFVGQFVETTLRAAGLSCRLALPVELPSLSMSATRRHQLFVIIKEALNNVIRHANAQTVRFTVTMTDRLLTLTVADDGCGFDMEQASHADPDRLFGGNGLSNMRKRMSEIGGSFELQSKPGEGTTLICQVKL
jgi:alpha-galactosidase